MCKAWAIQRCDVFIFCVALLLSSYAYTCNAIVINSDPKYLIKNNGGRSNCANEALYIGYLNKTCTAGAAGPTYGPTVGPVLRHASNGNTWRTFTLKEVGKTAQNEVLVEIKTSYPKTSSKKPLCQGFVVSEKKNACNVDAEPLADKVHIHAKVGDTWVLSSVKGKADTYTIRAYSRKPGCLKFLSAPAACAETYLQLEAKDDNSGRQHWTIIPASAPSPPARKFPPPSIEFQVPAVNYSIAMTGYTSASFGASEKTAFCDSILRTRNYRQDLLRCIVSFVTDVPFEGNTSGRKLMQASIAYVRGYTVFSYVSTDADSKKQAEDAADGLLYEMVAPTTLQKIFQSSFPSTTASPDAVQRGLVPLSQETLPTPSPSPTPLSPSPTPSSPSPTPASPIPSSPSNTLSPVFNTVPGGGSVSNDPPVSSPVPVPGDVGGPSATVPGMPTTVVLTISTGTSVTVAWSAPTSDDGAAITSYDVRCTDSSTPTPNVINTSGISPSACVSGACTTVISSLSAGETYYCNVRARNSAGASGYSADSNTVTLTCPTGQTPCGGLCKDLTGDSNNCGSCGTTCATGATCNSGVCTCPGSCTCGFGYYLSTAQCRVCSVSCATCTGGTASDCLTCAGGGVLDSTAPSTCSCPTGYYWSGQYATCVVNGRSPCSANDCKIYNAISNSCATNKADGTACSSNGGSKCFNGYCSYGCTSYADCPYKHTTTGLCSVTEVCSYGTKCATGWTNLNGIFTDGCEYDQTSGITGLTVNQNCNAPLGWSIDLSLGAYNMDPTTEADASRIDIPAGYSVSLYLGDDLTCPPPGTNCPYTQTGASSISCFTALTGGYNDNVRSVYIEKVPIVGK